MATLSTGNQIYLCHFCSDEFSNRAMLIAHFPFCQINKSTTQLNEKLPQPPQLNQTQRDILYMVKLHPLTSQFSSNNFNHHPSPTSLDPQIPLSNLYSCGYLSSTKQSSFDDSYCIYNNNTPIYIPENDVVDNNNDENQENSNILNQKLPTYHIYKYSRRERDRYYTRMKHRMIKKHSHSTITTKARSKEFLSSIFNRSLNFIINIPTKINSYQRMNSSNSNHIYPLLFCPHFHTLVQLPTNKHFENYLFNIRIFFHLIHSIASQEFQLIVNNYDNQQEFSYTSLSFINILRDTMLNYTTNLQSTFKRNHFQSLHEDNHHNEHDSTTQHDYELSIPPLKIRRYDDSSYEIEKRSVTTSSSSSSGMSITQVNNGQHYEDRRRLDTRSKKFSSRFSDNLNNSNFNDIDKKDTSNFTRESSLQSDLSIMDHQQSKDRTSNDSFLSSSLSHTSEQKSKKSTSPILIKEQSNDSLPKYQSVVLNEGARIRIVNCSNDNNKHSFSRNHSLSSTTKKYSNSIDKVDENWSTKTTRINTRKISSTNSKTSDISEVIPSYQAQSVLLSHTEIANQWIAHSVFYRCHACSHEEFFVVLSRECMRLHISSKHGNMEENFKQRISNFLNNQGRALKIFQHYLKWQQPWSEKEIDQIFQLSNINNQINGAL
ncbi:unnamed protein product [Adineta steineri]|uniref:Uncharacterized protein n=1 Tax=Adineta steineri TaxID=433720 RepID=A0A814MHL8_9BILA|nr:unnamed protein product [Adineta steineri]